jgi:hypothetical protein
MIFPRPARLAALGFVLALGFATQPGSAQTITQETEWTGDVPKSLRGTWGVNGRCDTDDAEVIIFSDGGYRWRKPDGSWGFARGYFSYSNDNAYRVLFKVRHLVPTPGYDAVLTVAGDSLRKTNLKSNSFQRYDRCPE